ncbi:MAG: hypothetical protein NXI24_14900 [bacterium]|nr:hypothetical protein [bacterium]
MQFTHRTVLRHAAVFAALILLPFAMMTQADALQWYRMHAIFFGLLVLFGAAIGWTAVLFVRRNIPAKWIAVAPVKLSDLPYGRRLLYQWASCSRCVAYWFAAGIAVALSLWFWPVLGHSLWAIVLRSMYFGVMGGSLAGAVAVTIYLTTADADQPT